MPDPMVCTASNLLTEEKANKMKRSGLITTKIGMTRLYDDSGVAHPVTVLSVGDCTVIGNRTMDKNGYVANILGMREAKAKHVAKPQAVAAEKAGVKPYRKVVEFRVSDDCIIPAGTQLSAAHLLPVNLSMSKQPAKVRDFRVL